MDKLNYQKKRIYIYLFLPVLPLLNIFVKNFYILSNSEKYYLYLITIIIYIVGYLLHRIETKYKITKYYLIWLFLFFNYYSITNFAFNNFPPFLTSIGNYAFYFYILNFIVITYLFKSYFEKEFFGILLNIFIALSIFTSSYYLFSEIMKSNSDQISVVAEEDINFTLLPDVYFIVFDNMANFKTLDEYYDYETSELREILSNNKHFVYENSTSLYGQTRLSMSSILNLEYLFPEGDVPFSTRQQIVNNYLTTDSVVYSTFEKNDYELFIVGENFPCDNKRHNCINYKVNDGFLYNLLINTPYSILVNNRSSIPSLYKSINKFLKIDCSPDCKEITFKEILSNIEKLDDPSRPNLVLIHNNNAHKPFRLDENCDNLDNTKFDPAIFNKKEYIDANACNVNELVYLSSNIKTPSVIIAQSDHGPRYKNSTETFSNLNNDDLKNKYTIFASVYGIDNLCENADKTVFYGVNTFRSLFNCLSQEITYEYLPIKSFYASYGTQLGQINYGFNEIIDITQTLTELMPLR
tara:strand:+ start:166 stop:1737 length:1572 start_codon:yes stop_codon:yes gene_type:complete